MDTLTRAIRRTLTLATALLSAVAVLGGPETMVRFNITEGKAAHTLKQFARQARLSIVYDARSVEDVRTNEVVGLLKPIEALQCLLEGTPLQFDQDQQTGAIAVNRAAVIAETPAPGTSENHNGPMNETPAASSQPTSRSAKKRTILATITALLMGIPASGQVDTSQQSEGEKDDQEIVELAAFEVTGLRASLTTAAEIKQAELQMVDSIVASDIDKLPDINASYALSRVPGIQVAHTFAGLGGNGAVTIRGLTQISNTIDGREVITPGGISGGGVGTGLRTFDYSQIPSSLIAGIDVYKTSAANQLDGGLGGLVDVRLRKPFDFGSGLEMGATFGTTYSMLADKTAQNYSVFANSTRETSRGKVGVLVAYSKNVTPWREDAISMGNPTANTTVATDTSTAMTASSYANSSSWGEFDTSGYAAVFQWAPSENLQLYAGVNFNEWTNTQDTVQLSISLPVSATVAGSGTMFPGSTTATQKATFENVTGTAFGIIRDLNDKVAQYSLGAKWTSGRMNLALDLGHYTSEYRFYNNGVYASVAIPSVTYDLGGKVPSISVSGASLQDPSIYRLVQVYNRLYPANAEGTSGKLDFDYSFKDSLFTKILAGFRYATTQSDNGETGLYLGSYSIPSTDNLLSQHPGLWTSSPIQNLFSGYSEPQLQQYLVADTSILRDPAALLLAYGDTTTTPETDGTVNPLSLFDIKETTTAFYVMPKFSGRIAGLGVDGNFGLRVVQTKEDLRGYQTITPAADSPTGSAIIGPIAIKSDYVDWLPSFNGRLKLSEKLYLRLAASKTITRPNFDAMSPSLTLNRNPIDSNLNSGSQGNPNLKPTRSTNLDLSLEAYLRKDFMVYLAAFHKDVKGFVASISTPQTYDGETYMISTKANLNPATTKGFEVGFQQFFTALPAPFDGFGLQANYTFVDSTMPSSIAGYNVPLTNLSRNSYNVVAMYEKGPFSARVAYNWRDKYVTGVSYFVNVGLLNQEVKAYADLDASVNYNLTKNIQISIQGVNLTNALRYQCWGSEQFPSNIYLDGRMLMANMSFRF